MDQPFCHTFRTKGGLVIKLRPLQPEDAPLLVQIFQHMSAGSRYLRFNQPLTNADPRFVARTAQKIAQLNPAKQSAWVAFTESAGKSDQPVGGVRFVRSGIDEAELALTVRDDLQNQGIGTELLRFAVEQARAVGIRWLSAYIQGGNRIVWSILNKTSRSITRRWEGSSCFVEVELAPAEPD
jgi:acetyltransferase